MRGTCKLVGILMKDNRMDGECGLLVFADSEGRSSSHGYDRGCEKGGHGSYVIQRVENLFTNQSEYL